MISCFRSCILGLLSLFSLSIYLDGFFSKHLVLRVQCRAPLKKPAKKPLAKDRLPYTHRVMCWASIGAENSIAWALGHRPFPLSTNGPMRPRVVPSADIKPPPLRYYRQCHRYGIEFTSRRGLASPRAALVREISIAVLTAPQPSLLIHFSDKLDI